jgi:hypothetical protein
VPTSAEAAVFFDAGCVSKEAEVDMKLALSILAFITLAVPARATEPNGFSLDVVSDGRTLRELHGGGAVYVEALKGRPYELRITNPLGVRVAVALAVDGRNTLDARRTSSWDAAKWVLGPYESTVISGWQVSGDTARLFTFTTEKQSYAAWLGDTANLGVIEAVFYRENQPRPAVCRSCDLRAVPEAADAQKSGAAPAQAAARKDAPRAEALGGYAATGMGDATPNAVTQVAISLDRRPVAHVRIRYEFHDQLVALGVLPRFDEPPARREHARGFSNWCPQP